MFNSEIVTRPVMAKALTGSFYLTETISIPNGSASNTRIQGAIDLGAYVSVANGQAISIDQVDFIYQVSSDYGSDAASMMAGNGALTVQLTDLNPATGFVQADNQSLVASGSVNIDQSNNISSHMTDLYPDNFGPANLSEAFMVVNDTLYLVAGNDGAATGGSAVYVTARIRCRIVKLSNKDWVGIAIQSTASDN